MSLVESLSVGSLLSDQDIKKLIEDNQLQIEPFEDHLVNPSSVDLRLGSTLVCYLPQTIKIGNAKPISREINITSSRHILGPGEFIVWASLWGKVTG